MAEKNKVVAGGKPVKRGTRNVAPNMATTCCIPIPIVSGQARRSSGFTTAPGLTWVPSPCSVQPCGFQMLMILLDARRWLANCAHRFTRIAGLQGSVADLCFAVGEGRARGLLPA